LGDLHLPDTITFVVGITNWIRVDFSSELGRNGHANDRVMAVCVGATEQEGEAVLRPVISGGQDRWDGTLFIPAPAGGRKPWDGWLVLVYVKANDPKTQPALSKTFWQYQPL
jgi:hypothetical protein